MPDLQPPKMVASQADLQNAKIDIGYRDFCAHLLIPLNACRRKNFYLPWRCEHERHAYEKCEYREYQRRVLKKAAEKAEKQ
ncbi:hypothetical protein COCSUDRAFT_53064 [Coccomyxa subellipsoidea C-169]|uniref:NADH dehydrogenase [ubiquinone] 1 beta subcomplex subunit 7 n=1 Tax=Coccomyxa subellipsoidea (strain C-169) TaxID=574566 RepID=I0Z2A3_COCSC|nr:hypothetical protein COCSUDRAFT_53064 [Coccomyxa subellipsoidea C-169]EIE24772.1 hypothetical protein COCSUDRAFT_53064 [Coccomyxa subellipsoidea C-169]|eukprot:XP_005649316.1 hypothetical protein COCSUDRAFT_53064 [Coccomyxa subellipsoidea C-169]